MQNIRHKSCLIVYTTTQEKFVIFTCSSYFKLSWNTTALSQSNCRNFSCSNIIHLKLRVSTLTTRRFFSCATFAVFAGRCFWSAASLRSHSSQISRKLAWKRLLRRLVGRRPKPRAAKPNHLLTPGYFRVSRNVIGSALSKPWLSGKD